MGSFASFSFAYLSHSMHSMVKMPSLKINSERLNNTLQSTCTAYGAIKNSTGMRRLALSEDDKDVRDWLVKECQSLGCEVKIDQMGNIFATRAGTSKTRKAIAMGSHLDTQPAGGRYDGILGVISALEVLRALHETKIETHCPITLINWTNEEGSRFPGAMMASGVWSTKSFADLTACHALTDAEGITFKSALSSIGYLGPVTCDYRENPVEAHFELHIEQGPLLEAAQRKIGIVTAVQGMKWFVVRVSGVEGHSGTTPMPGRSDALVTAARLIASVRDVAKETKLGVATVGVVTNETQSQATIPSGVEFIIDVRCSTDAMVDALYTAIFKGFDEIIEAEGNETNYQAVRTWGLPESVFDQGCVDAVREAALDVLKAKGNVDPDSLIINMTSRAGHDAAWTSKVVPTSMIFVPSRDGVSHNPNEYTSPEDCALGADVLLGAVLRYDEGIKMVDEGK